MQLIRGSSLTGFTALVTSFGGDPAVVLTLANLDPEDVGQRGRYVPLRNAVAAVEVAATVLNVADFGRQLATRQSIDILGPVGVAARTAATVSDGFAILDTYMSAYSPGIFARISDHPDPDLVRFEYDFLLNPRPPQAQAVELALGVTLRVLHLFLGSNYRPIAVHLPHMPLASKTDYRRYFGCPPLFNEPTAGFTRQRPGEWWTSDLSVVTRCDQRVVVNARRFGVVSQPLQRPVSRRSLTAVRPWRHRRDSVG